MDNEAHIAWEEGKRQGRINDALHEFGPKLRALAIGINDRGWLTSESLAELDVICEAWAKEEKNDAGH